VSRERQSVKGMGKNIVKPSVSFTGRVWEIRAESRDGKGRCEREVKNDRAKKEKDNGGGWTLSRES